MATEAGSKRTKPRSSPVAPAPQTWTRRAGRPGWLLGLVLIAAAGSFAYAPSFGGGVALAPDDPAARVRMGAILAQQRRIDEAVPHLERAVALRPDDPDARRLLADISAARGQDLVAVRHLERALETVPGDPRLMARLAIVLAGSRDPLVRNVARARILAREAVRLTGGRDQRLLDVRSAAEAAR